MPPARTLSLVLLLASLAAFAPAAFGQAGTEAPASGEAAAPGSAPLPDRDGGRYARTPDELVPYDDFGEIERMLFPEPLPYRGPGRDAEPPADLAEVRIGLLAPAEGSPEWREGLSMRRGTILAVEEANAAGGYRGLPFVLMEHDDLPIWGASSNEIVSMAYEEKVWAAIGSVSGDSSHIAIRVALKAKLPVMNTATGDPTLTETAIPWAFRCIADARQVSYALAGHLFGELGLQRVAVFRANSRYGRMGTAELRAAALRLGRPVVTEVQWLPQTEDFAPLVERLLRARPDGLVVWGGPEMAAKALAAVRAAGFSGPAAGPQRVIGDTFLELAGPASEGFTAVSSFDPTSTDPLWTGFAARYRQRWGEEPDGYAAHAYDGTGLVLQAVREAGLNRVRIRDRLAALEEVRGVTGTIVFDNTFNDVGPVWLAEVRDGAFRYRPAPPPRVTLPEEPAEGSAAAGPVTVGLLRAEEGELAALGAGVERGVRLALEERAPEERALQERPAGARAPGGYRLVTASVRDPWATVGEAARDLAIRQGAAGLVTVLDKAGSHVAAQVATRLRRPMAAANAPSPLLAWTGVPWVRLPLEAGGPDAGRRPPEEPPATFADSFRARWGADPDAGAVAGYLAARRLLQDPRMP